MLAIEQVKVVLTTAGENWRAKTVHTTISSMAVGMKVKMTARYSIWIERVPEAKEVAGVACWKRSLLEEI